MTGRRDPWAIYADKCRARRTRRQRARTRAKIGQVLADVGMMMAGAGVLLVAAYCVISGLA